MKMVSKHGVSGLDHRQLKQEFRDELHAILDWWSKHMVDEEYDGFYGRRDGFGRLETKADKGVILNTRILWTYSAAALFSGRQEHQDLALRAYDYICRHFWDDVEGGVVWSVDYLGNPVDTQKQIYGQAFAIYALCEYYFLTKDRCVLDKATELFWLIEKYSRDREMNGYLSAFARNWSPMEDIRLSEKDMNEAKIMNTHLHILEAYTCFYRVKPFAALKEALNNVVDLFLQYFIDPETGSMQVYFDENWTPKGDTISFGHNVEASWLLWEAAEALERPDLQEVIHSPLHQNGESRHGTGRRYRRRHPQRSRSGNPHGYRQTLVATGGGRRRLLECLAADQGSSFCQKQCRLLEFHPRIPPRPRKRRMALAHRPLRSPHFKRRQSRPLESPLPQLPDVPGDVETIAIN